MRTNFYLPILKSKLGEFTALTNLDDALKERIAPLFEVTPLEWDQTERKVPRTLQDHLDSFCKKLIRKWPTNNCFIDTSLLNWKETDNTDKIKYVFDKLAEKKIIPTPVASLSASAQFILALLKSVKKYEIKEIGVRVNPKDVTAIDFQEKLVAVLESFGFTPPQCHLIFDLADANFLEVENIADAIVGILESFPFAEQWKSFTVAGTAFPASNLIKEGKSEYARNEWKFYSTLRSKLNESSFKRSINYGDYSIVNPGYFEFNPKIMKASANIRYTHHDKWIVVKGKALKESADYAQYTKLAKQIFDSEDFLGESFSQGDLHLAKCVREEEGPGAPSVWNWVGNNHHFVKVLSDLSAMSPAS
jgi:hypothetical protein